jgi:tetratricopeptide (TPR) repeat protein
VGALRRAWRWSRRHPEVAGLLVLLAAVVAAGLGLVFHHWQRAEANFQEASSQRDEAVEARKVAELHRVEALARAKEAGEERDRAVRAEKVAEKHRTDALARAKEAREERDKARQEKAKADASFRQAHNAVNDFCLWVNQEIGNSPQLQALRLRLLRSAQHYYRDFLAQRGQDPALRMELAQTHELVAQIASSTGSRRDAVAAYQQAAAIYRVLHREDPKNIRVRRHLPGTLINLSTLQDARAAKASLEEALALYERFVPESPNDLDLARGQASTERNLGVVLMALGKTREGEALYGRALQRQQEMVRLHPRVDLAWTDLAITLHNLGALASRQEPDKLPLSLCYYLAAYEARLRLVKARPRDPYRRADLAHSLHNVGVGLRNVGRKEEHYEALNEALRIRRELADEFPHVTRYRAEIAETLVSLGRAKAAEGDWEQALASFKPARDIQAGLVAQDPSNAAQRQALGETYYHIGSSYGALGRRPEEEAAFNKARPIQEALVRAEPDNVALRRDLSSTLNNLGYCLKVQGKLELAAEVVRQAIDNSLVMVEKAPDWPPYRQLLLMHHSLLSEIERRAGRPAAAAAVVRQRLKLWSNDGPQHFHCAQELVRIAGAVGQGAPGLSSVEQAEREGYYKEAVAALRRASTLGLRSAGLFRSNAVLAPLRGRADFRALLEELEKPRRPAPKKFPR